MKRGGFKRGCAAAAATAALGVGASACGGDDGGGDGIAAAIPSDSALYFEASVRPEGDELAAIESVAARFPGGEDIGSTITSELDASIAEEQSDFSYAEDIEPWLGDRAAAWTAGFEDDPNGTVVAEVSDEDAAREAIAKSVEDETGAEQKEIAGKEATINEDGDAIVVSDGRLISGDEEGVEASLRAASGDEDSLDGSDSYEGAIDRVGGDDSLGYLQIDIESAIQEAGMADPDQVREVLDQAGIDPDGTFSMSLDAEDDALRSNIALPFDPPGDATSRGLIDDVPGDSLLAAGSANTGEAFSQGFDAGIEQSGESADEVRNQVESQLGIDPSELGDVLGDAGFFARGSTADDIQAGALLEVTDTAKVQEALASAQSALGTSVAPLTVAGADEAFSIVQPASIDQPVEVALAGDRLAVAYGAGGAAMALAPPEKLGDSQALSDAAGALGEDTEPGFILDVQRGLTLLEAVGAFEGEPDYPEVKPYLAPLGILASGVTGEEDGNLVTALVLTLTEGGAPIPADSPDEGPAADASPPPATEPPASSGGEAQATEGDDAERDITNNLREFNAIANSGNAREACNRFFSQAFLARLQSERQCANSIASARGGGEKTQIDVAYVNLDPLTEGEGRAVVRFGPGPLGQEQREVDVIYESGFWKIDAVNTLG